MTDLTDLTIEQRVANGAAWLDEVEPGWPDRINLHTLSVGSCDRCVLGQLFGEYEDAPIPVGTDDSVISWTEPRGFACRRGLFVALRDEWARVITSRREAVISDAR